MATFEFAQTGTKWWDYWWGHEQQMILHVSWAATQIWTLPEHAAEDSQVGLPGEVRIACLESFLVNVRLVTEFLIKTNRRDDARDFSGWDVDETWTPGPEDAVRRLYDRERREEEQGWWWLASQHVVHLSRKRLQDPDSAAHWDTSLAGLSAIREDVRAVWKQWLPVMEAAAARRWATLPPAQKS